MRVGALAVVILLLVGCLCLGYLAFRRVRLMRGGGVDVCLRRPSSRDRNAAAGWHFGVGRYRSDQLAWHRLTSFRPGPTLTLERSGLEILGRRSPGPDETFAVPHGASVLRCRAAGMELELAMAPGVLTGFLSWLEATPPGRSTGYRQAS